MNYLKNTNYFENHFKFIKSGIQLPITTFFSVCVSEKEKRELKVNTIKLNVLEFIRKNNGFSSYQIMDKFNISLDETLLVLKELANEKKLKCHK